MQMHSVETKAGMAIWSAPSRIAGTSGLPCSRCQLMFSIATVASSTRMPTASARPPSVMMLIVSPSALSTMIDVRIDSGIDTAMITVLRQLPRNIRIITAVRHAAITASRTTPVNRGGDEHRLVGEWSDLQFGRQPSRDLRQRCLDRVE